MKQLIAQQIQFILLMAISGMALMAGYDMLRLIRWLFPHGQVSIAAEDLLYWGIASVPVFYLFLEFHDGIIRWYGLVSVFTGIVLYEYGLSRPVRNKLSAFFGRIRRKWNKRWNKIREKQRQKRQKAREQRQQERREKELLKKQRQMELQEKRRQKQAESLEKKQKNRAESAEKRRQKQAESAKKKQKKQAELRG